MSIVFSLWSDSKNFPSMENNWESQFIIYFCPLRQLDRSCFTVIVWSSQYLKKKLIALLNIFFIFIGNFTAEIFKILYLCVIHNDFTSYGVLSLICYRLIFFWLYFHSRRFAMFSNVNTVLLTIPWISYYNLVLCKM